MKLLLLGLFFSVFANAVAPKPSFNERFIGTWKGSAPTKSLCSGAREKISLELVRPKLEPGQNHSVILLADWGCFSAMKIPGFIFADEFWGASDDRMTFVKLRLAKAEMVSEEFRFDLNGHTLEINFDGLKKSE